MRPCWKPDSSPLRSDQGESRTPTPVTARRSERRVSTCSTTWPDRKDESGRMKDESDPELLILHPSAFILAVRRAGVEPAQLYAGGLQPLRLANAQPTQV